MPDILHDLTIRADQDQVFCAVTEPVGINSWWTLDCEGIPHMGAEYRFYFGPEYDWYANVVAYAPQGQITWKFIRADEDWTGTELGIQVFGSAKSTRLRFEHTGWRESNDHFRRSSYCWAQYLRLLKTYLERGKIVPFEDRVFG